MRFMYYGIYPGMLTQKRGCFSKRAKYARKDSNWHVFWWTCSKELSFQFSLQRLDEIRLDTGNLGVSLVWGLLRRRHGKSHTPRHKIRKPLSFPTIPQCHHVIHVVKKWTFLHSLIKVQNELIKKVCKIFSTKIQLNTYKAEKFKRGCWNRILLVLLGISVSA